jgi:hypothetical protein
LRELSATKAGTRTRALAAGKKPSQGGQSRADSPGHFRCALQPVFSFDTAAPIGDKPRMPKKPGTNPKGEFAFFNVVYEDGSQRSNRRVPSELLGGLEGDEPARGYIMEQDREIADKSGRPPLAIKSLERVGAKKK